MLKTAMFSNLSIIVFNFFQVGYVSMWKNSSGVSTKPQPNWNTQAFFSGGWECASLYPLKIAITPWQYARNAVAAKMEVKIYILANI